MTSFFRGRTSPAVGADATRPASHSSRWRRTFQIGALVALIGRGPTGTKAAETAPEPFFFRISANRAISFAWPNPGRSFAYIIETATSLSPEATWMPAPASIWPSRQTSWTDAGLRLGSSRFFRALAVPSGAERGKLLSSTEIGAASPAEIQAAFALIGVVVPIKNGVVMHKVTYETVNPFGIRTTASGVIIIPDKIESALPLASYQHGTLVLREESPSQALGLDRLVGVALAAGGYLAAMPDYLGLGDSIGLHPYVHAKSLADASIDMLRATRAFSATRAIPLTEQLFLIGYSEGGYATMALHRELEATYADEFSVTASAPMAGPYDLSGTTVNDFLSGRAMNSPYYLPYLIAAYQSIYQLGSSFSALLKPPMDETLPPLLDAQHSGSELDRAIGTTTPTAILRDEFVNALRHDPHHPLRLALKENDLYDWVPKAPVRMFHCAGDRDVLAQNSQVTYDSFVRLGAKDVTLIDPMPTADHGSCAPIALLAAKEWFDTFAFPAMPHD